MNKVFLLGRLTRDAEVRWSHNNGQESKCVARYTIAVDRRVKADAAVTADFIGCVSFGKTAEFLEKYGKKGTKFAAEGRIQTGSYKNNDGQTIYTTNIVIDQLEFAESKGSGSSSQNNSPEPSENNGFTNIPDGIDEELPFV